MKALICAVLCWYIFWPIEDCGAQCEGAATVEGHVYRLDGSPVPGAQVEILPLFGVGAILPPPAFTDGKGFFHLTFPACGQGYVTASKVDEGYPNATLAIYGRVFWKSSYRSRRLVDLKPGAKLNVDLRFGNPNATIEFTVVNASHQLVQNARIQILWPEKPQMFISSSIPASGVYSFVLPRHAVVVTISAPGYANWRFRDAQSGSLHLTAKPGTRIFREVVLSPAAVR